MGGRTSGTRVGNGKGLWGPAKGASTSRFSAAPEHRGKRTKANSLAKIANEEEVLGFWTDVFRNDKEAMINRLSASEKLVKQRYPKSEGNGASAVVVNVVKRGD